MSSTSASDETERVRGGVNESEANPGSSNATGAKRRTAAVGAQRWATLRRVNRALYGKRRADLPLVSKASLIRKGRDDPYLGTNAIDELIGGVYSSTARKSTEARISWWETRVKAWRHTLPVDKRCPHLGGRATETRRVTCRVTALIYYQQKKNTTWGGGVLGTQKGQHFSRTLNVAANVDGCPVLAAKTVWDAAKGDKEAP